MSIRNTTGMKRRPTHPGEMLPEDFLPDYRLTVSGLADAVGVSRQSINELLRGRRAVSPEMGNFYKNDFVRNGYDDGDAVTGSDNCSGNCFTNVGAYTSSPSYYGTFDQGGNVREELEETPSFNGSWGSRGGSCYENVSELQASHRNYAGPNTPPTGFRVATIVPEPDTAMLVIVASALVCILRKARR